MRRQGLLLALFFLTSSLALASDDIFYENERDRARFMHNVLSLSVYQTTYSDITTRLSLESTAVSRKTGTGLDVGFRMHRIFGFHFFGDMSTDRTQISYGVGAKTYLPGFFLLGGNLNNLLFKRDQSRFFTYAQVMLENVESQTTGSYLTTGFRLGVEFRLLKLWSIFGYVGLSSLAGNSLSMHSGANLTFHF